MEKIHFETSNGIMVVGSIDDAHLLKMSRLTAVKVSTP